MQRRARLAGLTLAVAAAMTTLPRVLEAQSDWAISGRAGWAIPLNDLGRAQDPGPTFGAGLERIVERARRDVPLWGVRADVDVNSLAGATDNGTEYPKMTMIRYTLGVEYWMLGGGRSLWSARAKGAFGGTTISADNQPGGGDPGGTFATILAGLNIGVSVINVEAEWSTAFGGNRLRGQFDAPGNFKNLHVLSFKAGFRIPI